MRRREFAASTGMALAAWLQQQRVSAASGSVVRGDEPRDAASPVAAPPSAEDDLAGPAQGPWRRLFLDGSVIEQQAGLQQVFHQAVKHPANPLIVADRPWEGKSAITGPYVYGTVLREEGHLRLWYQVLHKGNHVGYAESTDGVHWVKPQLGLIDFEGAATNLVVSALHPEVCGGGHCHNPGVVRRPAETDPQRRYVLYGFDGHCGHPRAAFSPDGLRWQYVPETERQPLFRSSDVVNFFYDPYQQRYCATWKTRNRRGRAVGVAWSEDGLQWTKPFDGPVFAADDLDPDTTQIYGMPAFAYQGLYIGQPWIYRARYFRFGQYSADRMYEAQADSPRTMEVQLAWSWDMVNWTRPPQRPQFLPLGEPGQWDQGMIVTARAPVMMQDQLWFYYGGTDKVHDEPRVSAAIGLATLRLDGFCSMQSRGEAGWLISRREPFREPRVTINARTSAAGWVVAEILDRQNRVLSGFSREDCVPFSGDAVRHELTWRTARFSPELQRDDYKLRFWLKDADLYSYLPAGLDPEQPDLARFPQAGP